MGAPVNFQMILSLEGLPARLTDEISNPCRKTPVYLYRRADSHQRNPINELELLTRGRLQSCFSRRLMLYILVFGLFLKCSLLVKVLNSGLRTV